MAPGSKASAPGGVPRLRRRYLWLLADFALLVAVYLLLRHVAYEHTLRELSQRVLNRISTTEVERVGHVGLTWEGNVVLERAEVVAVRNDRKRLFYRSERIEIAFDANPLIEEDARVMRVDLFRPEIFFVRDSDGDWNALWALFPRPDPEPPPPPAGRPALVPLRRDPFPANGVHIHDGIVHIIFVGKEGRETSWVSSGVHGVFTRGENGAFVFGPLRGDFYGGRIRADTVLVSTNPFVIDMKVVVKGAEIAKMLGHFPRVKREMTGSLDMVLSVTTDRRRMDQARPVAAGRVSIAGGKLWELPAFVAVLAVLALAESGDNVLDQAHIEFTMERNIVRIDRMDILGKPLSLFGSGTMGVDARDVDITLVPRLGGSLNDIVPIGGALIQAVLDLAKGAIIPVRIGGTFWEPTVNLAPDAPVSEPVKELIEEKSPPK